MALLSWLAGTTPDNSGCKEALSSLLLEDGDFVYLFDCFSSYKGRALCKVPWHLQYLDRMRHLRMSSQRQHSYYEAPWQLWSAKVQTIGPSTPAFWVSASTMCKTNQGGVVAENQLCRNKCLFVRWINSLN